MRAADRRDRQGGHRVSERPFAGTRSDGILCLRNRRDGQSAGASDRHHHLQQRKRTARRLPSSLFLPLHPLPRHRGHEEDRGGASSRHQTSPSDNRVNAILRDPRATGFEEKTLYFRGSGLVETVAGRRFATRRSAPRRGFGSAQTAWRVAEKRAGRSPVRAPCLHGTRATVGKHSPTARREGLSLPDSCHNWSAHCISAPT
mmetsp:Transcript_3665/g.6757  ORF Transcript_3665/g.6757 Transcript_3665/m.6757 type:complete len:202 (+) Transcript_3665:215-820(+)